MVVVCCAMLRMLSANSMTYQGLLAVSQKVRQCTQCSARRRRSVFALFCCPVRNYRTKQNRRAVGGSMMLGPSLLLVFASHTRTKPLRNHPHNGMHLTSPVPGTPMTTGMLESKSESLATVLCHPVLAMVCGTLGALLDGNDTLSPAAKGLFSLN